MYLNGCKQIIPLPGHSYCCYIFYHVAIIIEFKHNYEENSLTLNDFAFICCDF
jgi:hypothetical protein